MKRCVLMIDDERGLVKAVGDRLRSEGYEFDFALDGDSGLVKAGNGRYDALILDVMLPGRNGYDIVHALRKNNSELPILMLSAKSQVVDRVSGLRSGADDYLVKPFDFEELLARLEVIFRKRAAAVQESEGEEGEPLELSRPPYSFGPFTLNFQKAALYRDNEEIPLSYQEFRLLCFFVMNRDEAVTNENLLSKIWGYNTAATPRTLYVHVSWLRKKLACAGHADGFIRTVRRIGYLFNG